MYITAMSRFDEYNLREGSLDQAAREGSVVPLVREIPADLVTPVGAFLALASGAGRSFLLESAERGKTTGRWSFLGWDPVLTLRAGEGWAERETPADRESIVVEDPLEMLREAIRPYRPAQVPGVPPFAGGLVGYLSYDAIRWFEKLPDREGAGGSEPWYEFSLYDSVVALDHLKHRLLVVTNLIPERSSLEEEYRRARERSDAIAGGLRESEGREPTGAAKGSGTVESLTSREEFVQGVRTLKDHILAGDIYQCVLSQRFVRPLSASPFSVYRALRRINPSPYLFYIRSEQMSLAGSSPEMLLRCQGRRIETHPIAGTRPRGRDVEEDDLLERELREDPKENAEHVMLVDLGRNDLGRVATPGSVKLSRFADVERYSHVMHLVSRVTAELARERDALHALAAAFPAGTVTGAPKIRAMELVDSLEPVRRGPYAGAVAYMDLAGSLDSCISIRTLVARDGRAEVQAGAGVVADSVPEREYDETVQKAEALMEAVSWAEEVLG